MCGRFVASRGRSRLIRSLALVASSGAVGSISVVGQSAAIIGTVRPGARRATVVLYPALHFMTAVGGHSATIIGGLRSCAERAAIVVYPAMHIMVFVVGWPAAIIGGLRSNSGVAVVSCSALRSLTVVVRWSAANIDGVRPCVEQPRVVGQSAAIVSGLRPGGKQAVVVSCCALHFIAASVGCRSALRAYSWWWRTCCGPDSENVWVCRSRSRGRRYSVPPR